MQAHIDSNLWIVNDCKIYYVRMHANSKFD